ncbi:MAG: 2-isopropylmalate synthase, partial [Candidatus Firestonebacteria bacterium]|nr:2-isopropylmalate synthase [Candidatus Firestonebacteria bacterium]
TKAPLWCSVDLRDGNQALPVPMGVDEKLELFKLLVSVGFTEIEAAFPSASETEFRFMRRLIEDKLIPENVTIQMLTQARPHLIEKSFVAARGARRVVMHLYNSTSELQRRVVFGKDKKGILDLAVAGARLIRERAEADPQTEYIYEYTPESYTGAELDFALEVCSQVLDVWQPTPSRPVIINLPSTVEMAMPNVYADSIEWMSRHLPKREAVVLSVHAHNDRGTAVAATELALLAGAQRVEGTLFGNGERTGNVDLVTVAMNLFSQGIDPHLDFSDMDAVVRVYEKCMKMRVTPRSPYAGDLVYTAFSGSHQDAIRKGLLAYAKNKPEIWEVPYLPIDPADVGRTYEGIIRINSQSGKGGAAYILESHFGFKLPKSMHPEFGAIVQAATDATGRELAPQDIYRLFEEHYLAIKSPLALVAYEIGEKSGGETGSETRVSVKATVSWHGEEKSLTGAGNGPIDAFFQGLQKLGLGTFKFLSYDEHALEEGADSSAVAYIQLQDAKERTAFGVGLASNISVASLQALINAFNRLQQG